MATITCGIRTAHRSNVDLIPARILKAIDQDELLDRLSHARDLTTRTRDPQLRGSYALLAKAMLAAQPRGTTEKEAAQRHALARRTQDPRRAAALRSEAARILERNPTAPRRADVAKARAANVREPGLLGVWTAKGALVGVIDRSDVHPVLTPEEQAANRGPAWVGGTTGMGEPRVTGPDAALPADGPQQSLPGDVPGRQVVKAGAKSGSGELVAVFDKDGNLVGVCDQGDITPLAEPTPSIGNPRSLEPVPPAEVGTPAGGVAKAAAPADRAIRARVAVLKNTLYTGSTAGEQNAAFNELNAAAIAGLDAIRGRSARTRPRR
jgi:hypothetical protein